MKSPSRLNLTGQLRWSIEDLPPSRQTCNLLHIARCAWSPCVVSAEYISSCITRTQSGLAAQSTAQAPYAHGCTPRTLVGRCPVAHHGVAVVLRLEAELRLRQEDAFSGVPGILSDRRRVDRDHPLRAACDRRAGATNSTGSKPVRLQKERQSPLRGARPEVRLLLTDHYAFDRRGR